MSERIAANCNRLLQKQAVRANGWTKVRRKLFLDTLAQTCNVRMAIEAAGMSASTAYQLRRRDPAFAELWSEALTTGYERLEEALLRHALEGVNAIEIDVAAPAALPRAKDECEEQADDESGAKAFQPGSGASARAKPGTHDVQLALLLLNRHRASVEGKGPGSGTRKRASSEETDAALRAKLDRLARQLRANP